MILLFKFLLVHLLEGSFMNFIQVIIGVIILLTLCRFLKSTINRIKERKEQDSLFLEHK